MSQTFFLQYDSGIDFSKFGNCSGREIIQEFFWGFEKVKQSKAKQSFSRVSTINKISRERALYFYFI